MPSKFGGIPVNDDEAPVGGSRFGGVPLEEEAPASWSAANGKKPKPRVGGQKVLDYAQETLSNIPGSAVKLAGNIGQAVLHPAQTGKALLDTATGVVQKMNPASVPPIPGGDSDKRPHADAAGKALKERYGSLRAIAETVKTDPVGAAADASVVAGGVSGLARGVGAVADLANLPRVAGGASRVAKTAGVISDATNPVNAITKPVGAAVKATAKPFVKSALGLPGKAERHGATPATAALEHTKGLTPEAIKESAVAQLNTLGAELENLARTSRGAPDLTAARKVIADAIDEVARSNGSPDELIRMREQLTKAKPGFQGIVTQAGDIAPVQYPTDFLSLKRQFGKDWTKFDANIPLKSDTRKVGNQAYHEMSTEFNREVPGAQPINQKMQSLVPVKEGAQRAGERVGPLERSVDRATRPTGGMLPTLFGMQAGGPAVALAVLAMQEGLSSPTVKMAIARSLFGAGKGVKSPATSRTLNTLGVAGEAVNEEDLPHYAKGGIAGKNGPELAVVGEEGPEAIIPLTAENPTVPERPETLAAQMEQLVDGVRDVVMFPRGSDLMPRPKGMKSYTDEHRNTFIFNPEKTSQQEIDAAIQNNALPDLLGAADGGMGAPDKSELPADAVAVVAHDPKGATVQATATDKAHIRKTVRQTAKVTPKGGKVSVEPPQKEIRRRLDLPDPGPIDERTAPPRQWFHRRDTSQWFHRSR